MNLDGLKLDGAYVSTTPYAITATGNSLFARRPAKSTPSIAPPRTIVLSVDSADTKFTNACHAKHKLLLLKLFASSGSIRLPQDITWFADNEASVSTIIRGACIPDDINDLAEPTMAMTALLRCWLWVEWTDSDSNYLARDWRTAVLDSCIGSFSSNMAVSNRLLSPMPRGPTGRFPCWS